jgi:biofilm PGA synthesis lipoprotein PgaB
MVLSDFEDDNVYARQQYIRWGLHSSVRDIRANKNEFSRWTAFKTQYVNDFAIYLANIVTNEQPGLLTAHKLKAQIILDENMHQWYSQILDDSIKKYDYTVVMTMPYGQETNQTETLTKNLVMNIKKQQCGLERTALELETFDFKNNIIVPSQVITEGINHLYDFGVNHIIYSQDDILHDNPKASIVNDIFSHKPVQLGTLNLHRSLHFKSRNKSKALHRITHKQ